MSRTNKICQYFKTNRCAYGNECHNKHLAPDGVSDVRDSKGFGMDAKEIKIDLNGSRETILYPFSCYGPVCIKLTII